MVPSIVTIDASDDLDFSPAVAPNASSTTTPAISSSPRSLLLAPPSIASHPDALSAVLASYPPRPATDLQMLDRLSAGFVSLPQSTYDLVLILADADGSRTESTPLLLGDRALLAKIADSLRPGGKLRGQAANDGATSSAPLLTDDKAIAREAVLAGLVASSGGEGSFSKPDYGDEGEGVSLGLKFGKNKKSDAGPAVSNGAVQLGGGLKNGGASAPAGVGFVDLNNMGEDDDDDDLIDEDTLLTEEDLKRPINIPPECAPKAGKRRRACKDCSCGLAQRIASEDAGKRADADAKLAAMKPEAVQLGADDLAEVDFTVPGKVGSCGSCALGDACDGCPYVGLPAWKPGEEVRLDNLEVQL